MEFVDKKINEALEEELSATEMAQLGTFSNKSLEIWVYGGEGRIPHFHFKNDSKNIEGCIRLDMARYFPHGGKVSTLSSLERKALIEFLKRPSEDIPSITNWQAIVFLWNASNRKYPVEVTLSIPDYTRLK